MQTLLPANETTQNRILCYYVNHTNQLQVVRISNVPNWYLERVLFPQQRLMFEATPEAQLEIHSGTPISTILLDKVPCSQLQVKENNSSSEQSSS